MGLETSTIASHIWLWLQEHTPRLMSSEHVDENYPQEYPDLCWTQYLQCRPLIALLFLLVILLLLVYQHRTHAAETSSRHSSSDSQELYTTSTGLPLSSLKQTDRPFGQWTPSSFILPPIPAYPNWSISTTKPLPYRPFRYGPRYNINMGLRSMDWADWIELDNEYLRYHAEKVRRTGERGDRCCRTDWSDTRAVDGAFELLEGFCVYLPQRYPGIFEGTENGMVNRVTGDVFDVRPGVCSVNRGEKVDPMQLAARMVQDDLAIMFEGADGQYYLQAGAILLPGFWRLEDKWKRPLSEIHTR